MFVNLLAQKYNRTLNFHKSSRVGFVNLASDSDCLVFAEVNLRPFGHATCVRFVNDGSATYSVHSKP